jgi:hypothetical protein
MGWRDGWSVMVTGVIAGRSSRAADKDKSSCRRAIPAAPERIRKGVRRLSHPLAQPP